MTQSQLEAEVAGASADAARALARLGFSSPPAGLADAGPEPLYLVVDCPRCGRATLFPDRRPERSRPTARCPGCEAAFGFDLLDVYVAASVGR